MSIKKILMQINNNEDKDFNIYEQEITNCGYKGLSIVSKKPNVENAYQISADLILNEIIYEVTVLDFVRCCVYTHYRDYGHGLGKQIRFEKEDFGRYARKDPTSIGKGVHFSITTLAITEDKLSKISTINELKNVIKFVKGLYPLTKPMPIIDGDPTESELVEIINYKGRDYKIKEWINEDNFHEGFLLEGRLSGEVSSRLTRLVRESKRMIEAALYFRANENKGFIIHKDEVEVFNFSENWLSINKPKLTIDNCVVMIKVFLDLEQLQKINEMNDFEKVFKFLQEESKKVFKKPLSIYNTNTFEEELPF